MKDGGFVVKYRVTGFDGERTTEVYPDLQTAHEHAADIRSFEGVQYATVAPAPKPIMQACRGCNIVRAIDECGLCDDCR